MNLEGTYLLNHYRSQKSDYEVFEGGTSHTYLQFEFIETKEDRFTLKFTKFNYNIESGERTGRIIDFNNKEKKSLQILLDSPIFVNKNEFETTELPIDWFYLSDENKSISYISNPRKEILRARKKLKKN